jgi:hypothetical protein
MNEDMVQVPRRLVEELARCLEGSAGGAVANGAHGSSQADLSATGPALEARPGRVANIERDVQRLANAPRDT